MLPRQQSLSYSHPWSRFIALTLFLFLSSAGALAAGESPMSEVKIENFGQVDENVYRGGQPKPEEFQQLSALGIKTVIDLRNDPEKYEQSAVEATGMHYVHIPMSA